ncbi:MBL fold metallo-hydrolase [Candidatus Pacearchaeota archaeon]|nr:MBL fold metallo-hydrolase [Candidatus Pacearchaeota archaeon]
MEVCALASGSSGNCFFVETSNGDSLLIDLGISCKQTQTRLENIGKKPEDIGGIFITHEHTDHIRGVDVFARKFNIPVFATSRTFKDRFVVSDDELVNEISNRDILKFKGIQIEVFSKSHKAADPVSYTIVEKNKRVSIITDAGFACQNVKSHIKDADFLFLESNHDEKMLLEGKYPWPTKKWIKSDLGHLSNNQASLAVLEHAPKKLGNVVLSHISQHNNTLDVAMKSFNVLKERKDLKPKVLLSTRETPTPLFLV